MNHNKAQCITAFIGWAVLLVIGTAIMIHTIGNLP
jgi:hypothetical protein